MQMEFDAVIIGAGASGLMCAYQASLRGRKVALIDHLPKFAQKILVSGGGRCNFTNQHMDASSFISNNPHFVKSALARFGPEDMMCVLDQHKIKYQQEGNGQYFLAGPSRLVRDMFIREIAKNGVEMTIGKINSVSRDRQFVVKGDFGSVSAKSLVIATGGLSYPKLGASDFGFRIADQFGLKIVEPRPALVPLVFSHEDQSVFASLAGVSCRAVVSAGKISMSDDLLFTHKGLSGPAILKISLHWKEGQKLTIDFVAEKNIFEEMNNKRRDGSKAALKTILAHHIPSRLATLLCERHASSRSMNSYSEKELKSIEQKLRSVVVAPIATEGYGTAEVTLGGVDTNELSSKTMEAKAHHGLYFIGEITDVTGDLGGYNLHFAWASGFAAAVSI